jgi:hypothetical protein
MGGLVGPPIALFDADGIAGQAPIYFVIASEAKQSSLRHASHGLDCFVA